MKKRELLSYILMICVTAFCIAMVARFMEERRRSKVKVEVAKQTSETIRKEYEQKYSKEIKLGQLQEDIEKERTFIKQTQQIIKSSEASLLDYRKSLEEHEMKLEKAQERFDSYKDSL